MLPLDNYTSQATIKRPIDEADERYLLNNYLLLVKKIVSQNKFRSTPAYDADDMEQTALLALIDAAHRFDNIYSDAFPTFAKTKIRGAILDELRRIDWRSRSARQHAHQLDNAVTELTQQLGRTPKEHELCQTLGITLDELLKISQAQLAEQVGRLDDLINTPELAIPDSHHEQLSIKEELSNTIKQLPKQQQIIISLIYQHELNQSEVAVVLELTKARVCQLHKQALCSMQSLIIDSRGTGCSNSLEL